MSIRLQRATLGGVFQFELPKLQKRGGRPSGRLARGGRALMESLESRTLLSGQIYAAYGNNIPRLGVYSTTGATVDASLLSGFIVGGVAVSGSDLFVLNLTTSAIGEYTTLGVTVNASLVTGLNNPFGICLSGSDLFVTNSGATTGGGTIGEYTTSGATVNASLISGLNSRAGIAVSGSDLFVTDSINNRISEYTTSGGIVNTDLIAGLNSPAGIAVSGSNLFVTNLGDETIGEYTTSGAWVNPSLITGVNAYGIAVSGSALFVTSFGSSSIGEYTTSGATVNANLVTGFDTGYGIAVSGVPDAPSSTPVNSAPAGSANNVALTPTLAASTFNDPAGNTQAAAEWLITRVSDGATIDDSGIDTQDLNSFAVSDGILANSTAYSWQVRYKNSVGLWSSYSAATTFTTVAPTAGLIFVTNSGANTIGEYTTSGVTINANLISGLASPEGIAVSGSNLFVVNGGADTVSEYTMTGATVNAHLIPSAELSGLSGGIAISGSDMFLANDTGLTETIAEYTTAGVAVNATLITGLGRGSTSIAVSGSDLFVTNYTNGTIGEYTLSGTPIATRLVSGLSGPQGIIVSGSNMFVVNNIDPGGDQPTVIGEYNTSGGQVNASLVTGLDVVAFDLALFGPNLYVDNYNSGTIGEYTASGAIVNTSLITGLSHPYGIAVVAAPATTPPPTPTGLRATLTSTTSFNLGWTLNGGETNVYVEQWNGSTWQVIANLPAGSSSYSATGLSAATTYLFDIVAANSFGATWAANYVAATTPGPAAPSAPSSLSATALSTSSIQLNWTLNGGETNVYVEQWNGRTWQVIANLSAGSTSYTANGLTAGTGYAFDVAAVNNFGATWAIQYTSAVTQAGSATGIPTALSATPLSATSIQVSWTLAGGETSVYLKGWNGLTWIDVAILAAGTSNYTVSNLAPSTRYYFDVVAVNNFGAAWAANYISAVTFAATPPAAATNLTATSVSNVSVHIIWTLNGAGATSVWVAKWNGTAWQMIAMLAAGTTSYTDNAATAGTNLYEIATYNAFGWSPWASPFATAVIS